MSFNMPSLRFNDPTAASTRKSILIIGASRGVGLECVHQLSQHPSRPYVHAFCRDPSKITDSDKALCTSVIQGDARNLFDLEVALGQSQANLVVVAVGNGEDVSKSDVRQVSAQALAALMKQERFQHVHALVVSSSGAGNSRIIVGMGVGKLISFHLRHVLKDHSKQEKTFWYDPSVRARTLIVRPTALTNNKATGKLQEFGDRVKAPTIATDRSDLVSWMIHEVLNHKEMPGGKIVNVTSMKQ